jgi:hypothetical protein
MELEGSLSCLQDLPSLRPCITFRNRLLFYGEKLLAPRQTTMLEDHPLSAVRNSLINIFAATLHNWRRYYTDRCLLLLLHSLLVAVVGIETKSFEYCKIGLIVKKQGFHGRPQLLFLVSRIKTVRNVVNNLKKGELTPETSILGEI